MTSTKNPKLEAILHNLWINAELFQHKIDAIMAVDMRTPDQKKEQAQHQIYQAGLSLIGEDYPTDTEDNEARIHSEGHNCEKAELRSKWAEFCGVSNE